MSYMVWELHRERAVWDKLSGVDVRSGASDRGVWKRVRSDRNGIQVV